MFKYAIISFKENGNIIPIKTFNHLEEIREYETENDIPKDLIKIIDPTKELYYDNFINYRSYYISWLYNKTEFESGNISKLKFNNSLNEIIHQEKTDIKMLKEIESDNEPEYKVTEIMKNNNT